MRRALIGGRSPLGVPPRHLRQRPNATAQLEPRDFLGPVRSAQPRWFERSRASQRMTREPTSGPPCVTRGRYPRLAVPVQRDCTRSPVMMPSGRVLPKPPGSRGDEPRPAGTALAPPEGVTRPASWYGGEIRRFVPHCATVCQENVARAGTTLSAHMGTPAAIGNRLQPRPRARPSPCARGQKFGKRGRRRRLSRPEILVTRSFPSTPLRLAAADPHPRFARPLPASGVKSRTVQTAAASGGAPGILDYKFFPSGCPERASF